jgi:flagellar basal-body rod protein FlgG
MMRALWTAASGMISQQTNVDVISNNLANVNTTGYKSESAQFKTLLYQTTQAKTTSANGDTKPVGAQVGLGTRTSAITANFTQGSMTSTELDTDFAIDGEGFFKLMNDDGDTIYTRNGHFNWSIGNNGGVMLTSSEGYPVLDVNGSSIELDSEYMTSKITIDANGNVCYPDETGNPQPIGYTIGLVQFPNPAGLSKASDSTYKVTDASGEAIEESENDELKKSKIKQGYLEASNVQIVDEMVNLIVAQRAYEMNSKAIQAADDMLQQANNLKR